MDLSSAGTGSRLLAGIGVHVGLLVPFVSIAAGIPGDTYQAYPHA